MAEGDQTQQTDSTPAAPVFDADALATQVAEKLKVQFQQAPRPPAPEPVRQQQTADPVGDLIAPYTQKAENMARLAEESASDAVEFYGNHQDLDKEDRAEIERRFKTLRANGVPFKREDIYNHFLGENIDKVVDKRIKSRSDAAAKAANASATVGAGSPSRDGAIGDARSLTTEQLGKALEGQSF